MSWTDLGRRLLAEWLGRAVLAAVVIGSGIAAQRLSRGEMGLELFENAAATAARLYVLILMFAPVSGALSTRWCPLWTPPSVALDGTPRLPTCPLRSQAASVEPYWPT
jgi:hypothetical protein